MVIKEVEAGRKQRRNEGGEAATGETGVERGEGEAEGGVRVEKEREGLREERDQAMRGRGSKRGEEVIDVCQSLDTHELMMAKTTLQMWPASAPVSANQHS